MIYEAMGNFRTWKNLIQKSTNEKNSFNTIRWNTVLLSCLGQAMRWVDISTSNRLHLRDGNGKVLIPWQLTSYSRMPGSSRSETLRRRERYCQKTVPTGNHSTECGNSIGLES